MRRSARLGLWAIVFIAPTALLAASSLVLNDGQIIKGSEVRREGDSYLVTMAGGNTIAFPAALVREVKIEDDAPQPPPGWEYAGPKQLAGPDVPGNQDPSQALKVFGPPTQWSKSAVDTTWVPANAYDPNADVMASSRSTWAKDAVDTRWVPTNAYDMNADVMKDSKSTWAKDAVDTTWQPTDGWGFKPLSAKDKTPPPEVASMLSTAPSPYARDLAKPPGPSPWQCAEAIFQKDERQKAELLEVSALRGPMYAALGMPLYEAKSKVTGSPRKAVFAITGGQCRLVGGDSDAILGLNLSAEHAMVQDNASFNAAIAARGAATVVPGGVDKLDYAFALVSLTDPNVSGSKSSTLKLISKPEELRTIAQSTPTTCKLAKGKRRKEERNAIAAFATPKISAGKEGDIVTFLTWSSAGGTLYKNTVVLARGGVVSTERQVAASHFGAHKD